MKVAIKIFFIMILNLTVHAINIDENSTSLAILPHSYIFIDKENKLLKEEVVALVLLLVALLLPLPPPPLQPLKPSKTAALSESKEVFKVNLFINLPLYFKNRT